MATLAEATTLSASSSHTYTANFPENWCIGAVPHGGFITSCFLQVASTHFSGTLSERDQPHTISLHLEFVRRTETGPAAFTVKDVKLGRMTSTIHITLSQDGREEVLGYISNSNIETETGVSFETQWSLDPPPLPVDLKALQAGNDAHWGQRYKLPFAQFRKASTNMNFFFPRQGQLSRSIVDQWISMATGEKFTNTTLGFVADMFPMIPEVYRGEIDPYSIEAERSAVDVKADAKQKGWAMFWYPTLLLNLDVKKALPEEGVDWLFVRTRAKQIKNGRYDLEVVIMDEHSELVALSHHVCMALSAERNLAKRKKPNSDNSKL